MCLCQTEQITSVCTPTTDTPSLHTYSRMCFFHSKKRTKKQKKKVFPMSLTYELSGYREP